MNKDYYYINEAIPENSNHIVCIIKSSVNGTANYKIQGRYVETIFDSYVRSYEGVKYPLNRVIAWKHVERK